MMLSLRRGAHLRALVAGAALALGVTACESGPKPIVYGSDTCAYCSMTIMDQRFGAELVTKTGKVHKFDSVECLAAYAQTKGQGEAKSHWVTDFGAPGKLSPAETALYLRSEEMQSPMGLHLAAFADQANLDAARQQFGGEQMNWSAVLEFVRTSGFIKGGAAAAAPR